MWTFLYVSLCNLKNEPSVHKKLDMGTIVTLFLGFFLRPLLWCNFLKTFMLSFFAEKKWWLAAVKVTCNLSCSAKCVPRVTRDQHYGITVLLKGSFWSCHHSCQATATKSGITFPQTLIVDKTSLSTVPITTQLQCLADMEAFDNMLLLCNRGFQNCWYY